MDYEELVYDVTGLPSEKGLELLRSLRVQSYECSWRLSGTFYDGYGNYPTVTLDEPYELLIDWKILEVAGELVLFVVSGSMSSPPWPPHREKVGVWWTPLLEPLLGPFPTGKIELVGRRARVTQGSSNLEGFSLL